jgi:hypothetical protein
MFHTKVHWIDPDQRPRSSPRPNRRRAQQTINPKRSIMKVLHDKRARIAGLAVFLGAALMLLPVRSDPINPFGYPSAFARGAGHGGHQGGGQDRIPNNESSGYTSYSAGK